MGGRSDIQGIRKRLAGLDAAAVSPAPILLVDDWPANLVALQAILSSADYELVSVRSGEEALHELAKRDFAVILLDVQMPSMDGIETASQMASLGPAPGSAAPIIFVTGVDANLSRVLQAYSSGAVDFIQKPLIPAVIVAKVAVFVELYRAKQRLIAEIEARTLLQDALRTRDDLLAVASHDLRNPLSIVLWGTKQMERCLEGGESGKQAKKAAGLVAKAVARMSRLVDNVLDMAKLEAGQPIPMNLEAHDIVALTREATALLEPLAALRSMAVAAEVAAPTHVLCDGDRVQQVLANLVSNAIKFTPEGGAIDVAIRRTEHEVVVSVRDTGTGISEDHLPFLFQPYWQADSRRPSGAGLGLFIVKTIVEAHGERIWVQSAVGQGTTVSFTLRALDPPRPPERTPSAP